MVLVDTSVWVDHLRSSEEGLAQLLDNGNVVMHSAVLGELACGSLSQRKRRIEDWKALPPIGEFCNGTALDLIESHGLMCRGIGLIDVHLVCSVLNHSGSMLWTRDKRLRDIAEELSIAFSE
jgi:predicted nucleic acid-binding protein